LTDDHDGVGNLPTGTVTFSFTDIEGSTRLLHEVEPEYVQVLAEQKRVDASAYRLANVSILR
jgi:class 3 adenylate cyclase